MKYQRGRKHKILSLVIAVFVVSSMIPMTILAEEEKGKSEGSLQQESPLEEEKQEQEVEQEPEMKQEMEVEAEQQTMQVLESSQQSESEVEINETNFPDEKFREFIKKFDINKNNRFSSEEITNITEINFEWSLQVESLKGIEYFYNLEKLDCSYAKELKELDISKNTKLQNVQCSLTGLSQLDVRNNTALVRLCLYKSPIEAVDVSNCKELFALDCNDTRIKELDISNNPKLYEVYTQNTMVTKMDYSHNPDLEHIMCSNNPLTELDVSNNPKLIVLYCEGTNIRDLNLSNNPNIEELLCNNNNLLTKLDLSQQKNLGGVDCSNTNITKLDVSNNKEITALNCSNTKIQKLDLSNNSKLVALGCANMQLTELNLSNFVDFKWGMAISPQKRTLLFTYDESIDAATFSMKTVVSDLSKVTVVEGEGYTYDQNSGIITLKSPIETEVSYLYDCGMKDKEPMKVTLRLQKGYKMLSNDNQSVEQGQKISFRSSADFEKFVTVYVDEEELSSEDYTVTTGSTIVTLNESFVQTLSVGVHNIRIMSTDGGAVSSFNVSAKKTEPIITTNDSVIKNQTSIKVQNSSVNSCSPKTGDNTTIMLLLLLFIAASSVIIKVSIDKKKNKKEMH